MFSFPKNIDLNLSQAREVLQKLSTLDPSKKQVVFSSTDSTNIPVLIASLDEVSRQIIAGGNAFNHQEIEEAIEGLHRLRFATCDINEIIKIRRALLALGYAKAVLKELPSIDNSTLNSREFKWARVEGRFNPESFLEDYNRSMGTSLGPIICDRRDGDDNYTARLYEACWLALFKLKDHYKDIGDQENYGLNYVAMGNFVTKYGVYPKDWKTPYLMKEFNQQLRLKLRQLIATNSKNDRLKKWSRLLDGMLYLNYIKQFPQTHKREDYLTKAFAEFKEAEKLKTTKTVYLLLAEVILDFKFIPEGLTREEAEVLGHDYIKKAFQPSQQTTSEDRKVHSPKEVEKPLGMKHARPRYFNELQDCPQSPTLIMDSVNQQFVSTIQEPQFTERGISDRIEEDFVEDDCGIDQAPPTEEVPQEEFILTYDALVNFDFSRLQIRQHSNPNSLGTRQTVLHKRGRPSGLYTLNGNNYRLQNVSGDDYNCFFNATGLSRHEQVRRLQMNANDPVVRYMIANEIVSSIHDPDQIPDEVKEAINYDLYQFQQAKLNELNTERSDLLRLQNRDEEQQNPRLLPDYLQNLGQREEEIIGDLRNRALSLQAVQAFITHYIEGGQMMVVLSDVQGGQGNNNYGSIDAIAHINRIGVRIYHSNGDQLQLAHEYIPEDADEIVNVYHEGLHYQALLPEETEDDLESVDLNEFQEPIEISDTESIDFNAIVASDRDDVESLDFNDSDSILTDEELAQSSFDEQDLDTTDVMSILEEKVKSVLIKLTAQDKKFVEGLLEQLSIMGIDLDDQSEYDYLSQNAEIRELIDNHFGEGTNVYIWVNDASPLIFETHEEYPVIVHLAVVRNKWSRSKVNRDAVSRPLPSKKELENYYPEVVTKHSYGQCFDASLVRKVLFGFHRFKLQAKQIGAMLNEDPKRISDILIANGIRIKQLLSDDCLDTMLHAYLGELQNLRAKKTTLQNLAKAISRKFDYEQQVIYTKYRTLFQRPTPYISDVQREEVVNLFLQRKSFREIKKATNLNFGDIIRIISTMVDPKDYVKTNLAIGLYRLPSDESKNLILKSHEKLKNKNGGQKPLLKDLKILLDAKAAKENFQSIGRQRIASVLAQENIRTIKKHTLDPKQAEKKEKHAQIVKEFKNLNPAPGKIEKAYKTIAKTHQLSANFVKNIVCLAKKKHDSKSK